MVTVEVIEAFPHRNIAGVIGLVEDGDLISKEEVFEFLPKVGDEVILSSKINYMVRKIQHYAYSDARKEHTVIAVERIE